MIRIVDTHHIISAAGNCISSYPPMHTMMRSEEPTVHSMCGGGGVWCGHSPIIRVSPLDYSTLIPTKEMVHRHACWYGNPPAGGSFHRAGGTVFSARPPLALVSS